MFGNKEAELLRKLQEAEQAEKMDSVPEAFANIQSDIDSVMPQTPMEEQIALNELDEAKQRSETAEDVRDVSRSIASAENEPIKSEKEIEKTNEQAKSPNLKTKEEMDPQAEYKKLIDEYRAKLAEPDKERETGAMDWITAAGQVADVFNTNRGFRSMGNKAWKDDSVDKAKAKKKEQLTGLEKLQQMHQAYQKMGKKDGMTPYQQKSLDLREKELKQKSSKKKVAKTAGQEALDKAFAKDYNTFAAQGGIASINKNIDKLKEAQKLLKKKNGPNLTGAVLGQTPDFIRNATHPESIAVRDSVESVIQQSLRQILGAQFTEKEAERLIQRSYNEKLDEGENSKRLDETIKELETMSRAKERAAKYFEKNGTLEGFKADLGKTEISPVSNKVRVEVNGKVGTVPKEKLEALLSKYPNAVVLD